MCLILYFQKTQYSLPLEISKRFNLLSKCDIMHLLALPPASKYRRATSNGAFGLNPKF